LNPDSSNGAQVVTIAPSSPASDAGLHQGDVITQLDGKPITSTQQFIETVGTYPPGQTITLTDKRGGSTLHIRLKLGTRPSSAPSSGG
jgi:serine protease Do